MRVVGIDGVASYVPPGRQSNASRQAEFGVNDEFIVEKLGVERVARKAPGEETSDLCVQAFRALEADGRVRPADVDCVIVCTQNPDGGGIPHTGAIVHAKLSLPERCASFDISLGCSGYVYGLSVMKSFMESNGFSVGLLFTADPYSKIIDPGDRNTAMLFGDAATATLLRESPGGGMPWIPRAFCFGTRGKAGDALHNRDHRLRMDGRAVFNFCVTEVPIQVKELLGALDLRSADVDLFLFHQGSRFMVDQLRARLGLPAEKVPIDLADYGNTVSSSIPLLLERYLGRADMRRIVLSGFGVGLSWASCLLARGEGKDER